MTDNRMQSSSIATDGRLVALAPCQFDKAPLHLVEQSRWQRSVIAGFAVDRSDVRSWPDEAVALGQHDPRPLVIKAQAAFGIGWDFDCFKGIGWRGMCDRQDTNSRCPVLKLRNNGQDENGPIFVSFFASFQMLPMPRHCKLIAMN